MSDVVDQNGNLVDLKVDAGGQLQVDVASTALPANAAQETGGNLATTATQTTNSATVLGATSDAAVDTDTTGTVSGKLRGLVKLLLNLLTRWPAALGAGGGLKVDGSGTPLPISAASLPLPNLAATEATLVTIDTDTGAIAVSAASIDSKTATLLSGYSPTIAMPFGLAVARGLVSGMEAVQKFGRCEVVGTTFEDIWYPGGSYTGYLTAASAVRIRAGGNANDTAAGTGARSIVVVGLDQNWAEVSETITTAGASASSPTTLTAFRVYRAYIDDVGSGNTNAGDIILETTGGTLLATIPANSGQTKMALYTVPAGKTLYIGKVKITPGAANCEVRMMRRNSADDSTPPNKGWRTTQIDFEIASGSLPVDFDPPLKFDAKTDLRFEALFASGASNDIACEFDGILVTN